MLSRQPKFEETLHQTFFLHDQTLIVECEKLFAYFRIYYYIKIVLNMGHPVSVL